MYYVMTCEGISPRTTIGDSPDVPGSPWNDGQPLIEEPEEPLIYTLDPDYPGNMLPLYDIAEPLMRADLLNALHEAGVDNLQTYQAIIRDPATNREFTDYKAVNIVGVISAADMEKSSVMNVSDSQMIDVAFDNLVLDESRIGGSLMFRLGEAVNAIVVHERIKRVIKERQIPGMMFYESGEWSG